MRLQLLGGVQMWVDDRPVRLGVRKQRFVMAVLGLEVNRLVPTSRLVDLVWPADPPASARPMVHTYISGLRAILAHHDAGRHGVALVGGQGGYELRCDPDRVDAHRFTGLLAAARRSGDDEQRVELLDTARALWRGPALAGVCQEEARTRLCRSLDEAWLAAVEERGEALLRLGRHEGLLDELVVLAEQHPQWQRITAQLMLALYRAGRTAEALQAYEGARRYLADELGLDPGPDLQRLHGSILRADPHLTGAAAVDRRPGPAPSRPVLSFPASPRPAQLPADLASFTGRTRELDALLALLVPGEQPPTVVISAIDGMAGVGKTALAVHAAHRLAAQFPDGQLFMDLHGFTRGIGPVRPADALDRMLRSLGIPGERIPANDDDRAALWRTTLAGRRILILLDNASGEAQVRPLLPGAPGCLVLITSRARLTGLDDTHLLSLDVLPVDDAVTLFGRAIGARRLSGEPPHVVAEVVQLCGRLPLAIRLAAARLKARPDWTIDQLAGRLRDPHRLAELASGERSVAAALDLSYQHLAADQQRTYRLVGLHPGADIDTYAAAALVGTAPVSTAPVGTALSCAGRLLDDLTDAQLLNEPVPGRYRFHDLTRVHAVDTAEAHEPGAGRHEAITRLFDYYAHTAAAAMHVLYPAYRDWQPAPQPPNHPVPVLDDRAQAAAWLDAELANLLAVIQYAAGNGWPVHCVRLSTTLALHLRSRARYTDAEAIHAHALHAARIVGDRPGELAVLVSAGHVDQIAGRYERAVRRYRQALTIAGDIDHRTGQLRALVGLGHAHRMAGRPDDALEAFRRGYELAVDLDDRTGQHEVLIGLGHIHRMAGRADQAVEHYRNALAIAGHIDDRNGAMQALWGLADVDLVAGRHQDATEYLRRALAIARQVGHRTGELTTLQLLSDIHSRTGRHEQATDHLQQSLMIARQIGHRTGELNALWSLGHIHHACGRHRHAITCYQQALAIAREIGDRNGEFEALHGLATTLDATGRHSEALTHHESALQLVGELGQPHDEARAHDALALTHLHLGHTGDAREHWERALALHTTLGTPEEATVRARLDDLDGSTRAASACSDQSR